MAVVNHHKQVVDVIVNQAKIHFAQGKLTVFTLASAMNLTRTHHKYVKQLLRNANLGVDIGDIPVRHKLKFTSPNHVEKFLRNTMNPIPISSLGLVINDIREKEGLHGLDSNGLFDVFKTAEKLNIIELKRVEIETHTGKPDGKIVCMTSEDVNKFAEYYADKIKS